MDRLHSMRVFARVAELGSFAGAARAMELSPAVVTRLVADLESHLGARLLNRTTRSLALTETGEDYLQRVQDVLERIEEAENVARDAAREVSGTLRVAAVASFAAHALAPHLPRFFQRYPKVKLELTSVAAVIDGVDEAYDVSLLILPELPEQATFIARRLACTELIACASPAYLAERTPPQHPDDLQHHPCQLPAFANPLSRAFVPRGGGEPVFGPPASHLVTTNVEALREAAEAGLGITALPSFLAATSLASGRLQWVLSSWRLPTVGIWAGLPTRRYLPARTRAFVDWLVEVYGGEEADPWLKDRPAAS